MTGGIYSDNFQWDLFFAKGRQKISCKSIIFEDKLELYLNKIFPKIHALFEHCCFSLKQ